MQGLVAKHVRVAGIAWSAILACAACAVIAAPALAADLHAFDPVLSLTGGCGVSKLDEVPDPGCPEDVPGAFEAPRAVTTDFYGNVFVSSGSGGEAGRIDVFDPDGFFIAQVLVPSGPRALAVDSKGNLYVVNAAGELRRYEPSLYEPKAGKLEYKAESVLVAKGSFADAIAINVLNDRLFVYPGGAIKEYSSAAEVSASEGNKLLDGSIGDEELIEALGAPALAIDGAHGRIYASESGNVVPSTVKVFDLDPPHELLLTVDGEEVPAGELEISLALAADEGTGHFFLYSGAKAVYEFSEAGEYLGSIKHSFNYSTEHKIGVDNGPFSPNGALNLLGRYLFVPSHPTGEGHVFAFGPEVVPCPPVVNSTSFAEVTESEAELQAQVNPCNDPTTYTFEYTTLESFEEEGFEGAQVAGEGQLPAGATPVAVSAPATGLAPDTAYRFRVVAVNGEGGEEEEGEFRTYPVNPLGPCPNDALRTGFSEALPDCRAYELVTPPDTNARTHGALGTWASTSPPARPRPPARRSPSWSKAARSPATKGPAPSAATPISRPEAKRAGGPPPPVPRAPKRPRFCRAAPRPTRGTPSGGRRGGKAAPRSKKNRPATSATPTATRSWSAAAASPTIPTRPAG